MTGAISAASFSAPPRTPARYALWLFVLTIPLENVVRVPGVGSLARVGGVAAFLAWGVDVLGKRAVRRPGAAMVLPTLFVVWSAATVIWSIDPERSVERVKTALQLLLLLWLIWDQIRSRVEETRAIQAYVWGCVIAAALTLVDFARGGSRYAYAGRYAASGFDPNGLGVILAIGTVFILYLLVVDRASRSRKVVLVAGLALCEVAVLLTGSRGAVLAGLAGLTGVACTSLQGGGRKLAAVLLLVGTVAVMSLRWVPGVILERLATIPFEVERGTLAGRRDIWRVGLDLWRREPLAGVGVGAFMSGAEPLLGQARVAHNTFVSVLVETGAVGELLFASWVLYVFYRTRQIGPIRSGLWLALLLTWVVGALSLNWEFEKPTWFLLGLAAALGAADLRRAGAPRSADRVGGPDEPGRANCDTVRRLRWALWR